MTPEPRPAEKFLDYFYFCEKPEREKLFFFGLFYFLSKTRVVKTSTPRYQNNLVEFYLKLVEYLSKSSNLFLEKSKIV